MKTLIYNKAGLFFGLATIIPWSFWLIASYLSHQDTTGSLLGNFASVIAFLGLLAPVGVVLVMAKKDQRIIEDLRQRIFNFKSIKSNYIVLAFVLMPVSILLAQGISLLFGYSISQFQLADTYSFTSGIFPVWFMLIIAPIIEELAWHTYGTDALRSRFNLFTTSIIFALFWGIWHLPCSLIKDYYHSNLVEQHWIYSLNFIISLFPFVLIMNWIYYKTNRNIVLPIIFHITAGYFNEIFATHPMSKVIQTVVLAVYAVYIIGSDKTFFFSFKDQLVDRVINPLSANNNIKLKILAFTFGVLICTVPMRLSAQEITQSIRGSVYDNHTAETLPFANIVVKDSDPLIGTVANIDGEFVLEYVPLGRQTILISMIGYDTYEIKELLVSSGQMINLEIGMVQSSFELDEVVVRVNKSTTINGMSTLSSRQFTVEETQRYAGGMDDPARLASSFAGVSNPSITDNGISVRGNNPDGLLWRIEGMEVPNPNHFANLTIAGGGLLSAISNQMMSNSDFYTGAFPAEYGNASSGVFDIKLREGNKYERQYVFEGGILGVGAMVQGPFNNKSDATFIVNYRNSTMALLAPVLPDDAGILKYQDLSFKTSFPTKNYGTFSFWGLGALDGVDNEALDSTEWKANFDRDNSKTNMYMYAAAMSHKVSLPSNAFLNTSIGFTGNGLDFSEERLNFNLEAQPQSKAKNNIYNFNIQSELSKRFSEQHTNKTGFRYKYSTFDIYVEESQREGELPILLANQTRGTGFMQLYSQSKYNLNPNLVLNAGINAQYLMLNKNISIEPRAGLKYHINNQRSIAFAYGIHSRKEQLPVYFTLIEGNTPNTNLEFMKSTHYVLSYNSKIGQDLHLTVEPYYQRLSNVPVASSGYITTLNNNNNTFFNDALVSEGKGVNKGIDITLEKFLSKGYYYMLTASLFDSKYTGKDGIQRNTRFNRNYVFNLMAGKEWKVRENNVLSANVRVNYLGGNRIEPIDIEASISEQSVVYGEKNGHIAFDKKHDALPVISLTLSYRKNKANYSSVWALKILNFTGSKEFSRDFYNIKTNTIEARYEDLVIPNLSYKIEF